MSSGQNLLDSVCHWADQDFILINEETVTMNGERKKWRKKVRKWLKVGENEKERSWRRKRKERGKIQRKGEKGWKWERTIQRGEDRNEKKKDETSKEKEKMAESERERKNGKKKTEKKRRKRKNKNEKKKENGWKSGEMEKERKGEDGNVKVKRWKI